MYIEGRMDGYGGTNEHMARAKSRIHLYVYSHTAFVHPGPSHAHHQRAEHVHRSILPSTHPLPFSISHIRLHLPSQHFASPTTLRHRNILTKVLGDPGAPAIAPRKVTCRALFQPRFPGLQAFPLTRSYFPHRESTDRCTNTSCAAPHAPRRISQREKKMKSQYLPSKYGTVR